MHGHRFSLKAAVPRFILRSGFQTPHFRALSSAFPGTATGKRVLDSDGSPKVCFISGAASGIGRASAIRLASEGGIVVVADLPLQEAAGRKVVEECNAENPKGKAMFVTLDVTVESQWEAAMKAVEKQYGRLDVICNNAGVYFSRLNGMRGDLNKIAADLTLVVWLRSLLTLAQTKASSPKNPSKPSKTSKTSTSMASFSVQSTRSRS